VDRTRGRRRHDVLPWVLLLVVATWWLGFAPFSDRVVIAVDDLTFVVAPAVAAVCVAWRARRCRGRQRAAWASLSLGLLAWAAGEVVWTVNEVVLGRGAVFPSWADAGYLVLPVGAGVALLLYPVEADSARRPFRRVLDGLIISGSLLIVWWVTVLSAVARVESSSRAAFVISLSYPVLDIALLSTTLLVLGRSQPTSRRALLVLAAGLGALAVADSGFAWLSATGSFETGGLADLPWLAAFALIAIAAGLDRPGQREHASPEGLFSAAVLPYVPFGVAAAAMVYDIVFDDGLDALEGLAIAALLVLVLARQFLTVHENRELARDLSRREAQLRHQAFHDALTGLANRELFADRVEHALSLRQRDLVPLAVLFLDLDDFKLVNDTLGHSAGDALLVRVAERLRGALRPGETIARLGGDEFAVLLENDPEEAGPVGLRLLESLGEPFTLAGHDVAVQASVGVAELAADAGPVSAEVLLARADMAMYAAKRGGKARVRLFTADLPAGQGEQLRLRARIADAVRGGEIELAYQPLFDLQTRRATGAEALARWRGPDGPVSPATFVPMIESAGLGRELSRLTIARAAEQLGSWNAARGDRSLMVGLNLTADQLVDPGLDAVLRLETSRHGVDHRQIIIEITESSLLYDLAGVAVIVDRLRSTGFRVALDDFGTGYSSMTHLVGFNLDYLKIDRSFVGPLPASVTHTRFVRGLIALARETGLTTVAEGIETVEQLQLLRALGCTRGQGYLLARPAPAADLAPLLVDGVPLAPVPASVR
jgi:diguanylate cyclase (GGDEF)-like protein